MASAKQEKAGPGGIPPHAYRRTSLLRGRNLPSRPAKISGCIWQRHFRLSRRRTDALDERLADTLPDRRRPRADYTGTKEPGYSGIGTTLSANPLQFAAMRATLEEMMTDANYAHMEKRAARLEDGLSAAVEKHRQPWHVVRVGARIEFICAPGPLRNGFEAQAAHAPELEAAIHVALVNRGVLIAPFHNMMLVSPATTARQIGRLVAAFGDIAARLAA